ncbi:DUF1501 domain-containing protein [Bythopirellula polymerisocia]|uniref:Sulfatase n=1 Tax=Bythopirellula polymerisocia TaxID=2528003 RepID=A0A5C6CLP3_9BACT|nr:DUF1501 domain-containing protein [Bythopirellula polymerisocia]TWU23759.1 hypothetical protein Pla144_39340 [Bythopirellula polymerisocia]
MKESLPSSIGRQLCRRTFLAQSGLGLGSAALATMLGSETHAASSIGLPTLPNLPQKVKRVIFLCMAGGPSHLETFDYKPTLEKINGQPMPVSYTQGQQIAQLQGQELIAQGPMTRFGRYGQSGQYISDFFPYHRQIADEICVIRSMVTEQINHDPAHTFMNTGTVISGRPSMGAWINYGLGCENQSLPGFVVLVSVGGRSPQPIASRQWSAGFLPSQFQGVPFNSSGDPVHYIKNPPGVSGDMQRRVVDSVLALDGHRQEHLHDPDLAARLAAYETAFRMQTSVPELVDMSDEPQHVLDLYGAVPGDGSYASNCLLARRLAERGVRFIHLYHRGWDHHGDLVQHMNTCSGLTDKATAALVLDLKQRGMLADTLIVWGGEFGRTPMFQGKGGPGRDHHIKGFSMWVAGGNIRPGISYGATDELGYNAVENPVHVRDLHATMLHLLGIDHKHFTVKFQGLDMRLTGVEEARVIHDLLS